MNSLKSVRSLVMEVIFEDLEKGIPRTMRGPGGQTISPEEYQKRLSQGKRNWWTWVFHHGDACCFVTHRNRSKIVVSEFLGDYRPDFWISDRYGAQMGWAKRDHQFCLAHLIRDAKYAIDAGDT